MNWNAKMSDEIVEEWLDESFLAEDIQEIETSSEIKRKYTRDDFKNAVREVSEGLSAYAASIKYNVPK